MGYIIKITKLDGEKKEIFCKDKEHCDEALNDINEVMLSFRMPYVSVLIKEIR